MPADEIPDRPRLSDLHGDLTDSDVVIEVGASAGARRAPDLASVQRLQDAVEASYQALAASIPVQSETLAVLEEVAKRSLTLWVRFQTRGGAGQGDASDASLQKFLARGTLAI